jgi:hypothetical protein
MQLEDLILVNIDDHAVEISDVFGKHCPDRDGNRQQRP